MLRLPEENIEYLYEHTMKIMKVLAFAFALVCIIGLVISYSGRVDRAVEIYEQDLNREKAIEQLPMRMK